MRVRRLVLILAALVAVATLAGANPVVTGAQGGGETDTTETDTTETPAGEETPAEAEEQGSEDAVVALGALVFGGFALWLILRYLNDWRKSSADLIKSTLAATGQLPDYEFVGAALPDEGLRDVATPTGPITIRGPALVHVGRGARFVASQDDKPVTVEWALEPAEAGRLEPASGEQTTVTPARLGPLTVRATAGEATAEAHAVAVAAPRRAGSVPLVGVGYGGITIAIVALTLAAAATLYGSLDGAALVALAGAVVGYFFVEARGQQAASPDTTTTTPPAAGGAGGAGDDQTG